MTASRALVVLGVLAGCEGSAMRSVGTAGGKTTAAWNPGDPIPGWTDYDCGEMAMGAAYVEYRLPELIFVGAVIESWEPGYTLGGLAITACPSDGCTFESSSSRPTNAPFGGFSFDVRDGGIEQHGQGLYGGLEGGHRVANEVGTFLKGVGGEWDDGDTSIRTLPGSQVCVSKFRPDVIEGVMRVADDHGTSYRSAWYESVVTLVPFSVILPAHSWADQTLPTDGFAAPAGTDAYDLYLFDYDTIWPWDEITDSAVRDAVYARYLPWNTP